MAEPTTGPTGDDKALRVLQALYAAYEELARDRRVACGPGCAACCSDRVLMTSLEGRLLARALEGAGRVDLLTAAAAAPVDPSVRPQSTFNALARLCLARQEPPASPAAEPAPARSCPLLVEGLCAAYEARPLACRTMASRERCAVGGAAIEEPLWLSLNAVFFQLVEQCSLGGGGGWFGLMPEVLAAVRQDEGGGPPLLACEPLPGLVVPPEEQAGVQQALQRVFARPLQGRPLGLWLDELRQEAGY